MKGHEAIIHLLHQAGVDTVFGLMSEDTMEFMSEIHENWQDDIRLIQTRHEQGSMAMADGYSRASGDIGVCVVGRGPAIAQTGTSLVTASKNGSNLLVITPEPSLSADYDVKEFEQETYLQSTVGNVVSIRSHDRLVPEFQGALRRLWIGEGPIAVQVAWDLFDGEMNAEPSDLDGASVFHPAARASEPMIEPAEERIEATVDLFLDSDAFQPPIILAGQGAVQAGAKDALEALARRTSGLLATTLQARGYFADHPFSLGFIGSWGNNLANEYFIESDFVLAVGCSLNPYTLDSGYLLSDDTKVVHVDTAPASIERYTPVDIGILGDARIATEALAAELESQGIDRDGELWTDELRDRIANHSPLAGRDFPDKPGTMDPRELVGELNQMLPDERLVVTDGGHFTRWVMDGILTHPDDFVFSLDFAAIGQGLGMGIGAALAGGDRSGVAICGDAGFMMAVQELETAARHDVPLTVIVMNDSSLGSEYHNLAEGGAYADAALIPTPDFAAVAEAFGASGYTATSLEELAAIEDVLATEPSGPVVVDCKVNHEIRHRSKM